MSASILPVPESVAAHIEAQRTLAAEAFSVLDTAIAALPGGSEGPDARGALAVARRLLEQAIDGLDPVNLDRAAAAA